MNGIAAISARCKELQKIAFGVGFIPSQIGNAAMYGFFTQR
jgi:hypothetical protein